MHRQEREFLAALDAALQQPQAREWIDSRIPAIEQKLLKDAGAALAWTPVPLECYAGQLPPEIRSSWIFILRGGMASGAERHPNSHQRVTAYRGTGDFQVWCDEAWRSHFLLADPAANLEDRWESIPPSVWHQAVVAGNNWAVVSFHTAAENELIEERPNAQNFRFTEQRRYSEMRGTR